MNDEEYMQMALEEAVKGVGHVNPNPLVGAVIVKDGRILATGYHKAYGELHAERNAFKNCAENTSGATLYVTLEPCCHYGKTPPCTEVIMEHRIKRVVVGCLDPNPLVAGKGIRILQEAGIQVETGVLEEKCKKQNEVFLHYIKTKTPFVVMKYAMTLDGKIATATGKSKWITGEVARQRVQQDRNRYMVIMVGIGTVFADDPMLNCRLEGGRSPIRIICDSKLRTPMESKIVATANEIQTILATTCKEKQRQQSYLEKGCQIVEVGEKDGHLDLQELMRKLGERGIDGVYLEGGGTLNDAAIKAGIVNKVQAYISPKLFGGTTAKTPVEGSGIKEVAECLELDEIRMTQLGKDVLLEGDVKKCSQES